ncbi:MAG TPA: pectate lyase, partial [Hanamia sp.]|nr:pectate lyase [Hanamia sp.]
DVVYKFHEAKTDKIVVHDSAAPPLWTRYYELKTNRPLFANRDGKKVYNLSDVSRERRTGYAWYGYWPQEIISSEYPAWLKRIE